MRIKAADTVGDSVCHLVQFGAGGRLHPLKPGVAIGLIEVYAVYGPKDEKCILRFRPDPAIMLGSDCLVTVRADLLEKVFIQYRIAQISMEDLELWGCSLLEKTTRDFQ